MYHLALSSSARRDLRRLPAKARDRVSDALTRLSRWPDHGLDVRLLRGRARREWRLRVGSYRAIFRVNEEQRMIWITRVGHRQSAYQ